MRDTVRSTVLKMQRLERLAAGPMRGLLRGAPRRGRFRARFPSVRVPETVLMRTDTLESRGSVRKGAR